MAIAVQEFQGTQVILDLLVQHRLLVIPASLVTVVQQASSALLVIQDIQVQVLLVILVCLVIPDQEYPGIQA